VQPLPRAQCRPLPDRVLARSPLPQLFFKL
jgi:hypothetical protein